MKIVNFLYNKSLHIKIENKELIDYLESNGILPIEKQDSIFYYVKSKKVLNLIQNKSL